MSVNDPKQHTEKNQFIVTVKMPVFMDIRVEADNEEEAIEIAWRASGHDSYEQRGLGPAERKVVFACSQRNVLDLEVNVYDENMSITDCQDATPLGSGDRKGGE